MVNAISDHKGTDETSKALRSYVMRHLAILLAPFSPHIAEEIWHITCAQGLVSTADWPAADEKWLVSDTVDIAVQVNGKLRDTIKLERDCPNDVAEKLALASASVQRYLEGKTPKKVIVVQNRIINVVA